MLSRRERMASALVASAIAAPLFLGVMALATILTFDAVALIATAHGERIPAELVPTIWDNLPAIIGMWTFTSAVVLFLAWFDLVPGSRLPPPPPPPPPRSTAEEKRP